MNIILETTESVFVEVNGEVYRIPAYFYRQMISQWGRIVLDTCTHAPLGSRWECSLNKFQKGFYTN